MSKKPPKLFETLRVLAELFAFRFGYRHGLLLERPGMKTRALRARREGPGEHEASLVPGPVGVKRPLQQLEVDLA